MLPWNLRGSRFPLRSAVVLPVLALLAFSPPAALGVCKKKMVAILTGAQETPPNASTAVGCATLLLDTGTNTLSYYIVLGGLGSAETAAHIHGPAEPTAAAGILHTLPAGSPKIGTWNYPEAMEADILAGRMYINIHTVGFGGGEIRGQIVTHVCEIDAAQETPPVPSAAKGWGVMTIDTSANTLKYFITYSGLSSAETAAHFHGVGGYGAAAGVKFTLPAGSPKSGVWNYPEAEEAALMSGLYYVNIHTTSFGGGEIRGQMINHVVPVDPTQETPPVASSAAGVGMISLNEATNALGYDIRYNGMVTAETAAHIHGMAPKGMPAGVLHTLPAGVRKLGSWTYTAAQEPDVLKGLTYINIHSLSFGGGEIRGQMEFADPPNPCVGDLDGDCDTDQGDLGILLASYLFDGGGDLDGDGDTDQSDLGELLGDFGCGP